MSRRRQLEKLLQQGMDSALLRFSLGNECLADDDPASAATHFRYAVEQDPDYSAAWKMLGKALADSNDRDAAIDAYEKGIACAEARGDQQAMKEMAVFLRRLQK